MSNVLDARVPPSRHNPHRNHYGSSALNEALRLPANLCPCVDDPLSPVKKAPPSPIDTPIGQRRLDELELGSQELCTPVKVVRVEQFVVALHDLHVLPRHSPRSISDERARPRSLARLISAVAGR